LSIHLAGIIGLILIFLIGTLRSVNLGTLSIVMTFLVGAIFARESVGAMAGGFPAELFILLAGVTYLFAIASNNGTVDRVVTGAARLFKDRRALIPWIVFVAAALPAMGGALGSAGVALLAPLSLRLARRYGIDARMIGLMVVHGAASGNFSPLNVLGAIVVEAVQRNGLQMSPSVLFLGNLAYNLVLGAVIYLVYGGLHLVKRDKQRPLKAGAGEPMPVLRSRSAYAAERGSNPVVTDAPDRAGQRAGPIGTDQVFTLFSIAAVAALALIFGINVGFIAFCAAALLQMLFPASSGQAEKRIAWSVVLLVCGIVTYVTALQRYGTVDAVGAAISGLSAPLLTGFLICAVGAVTSAFASSAGILGAMIPLALPFMLQGEIGTTGMVTALAISATVVDATPFSTVGALVVANTEDDERLMVYRGLLVWGGAMVITAPVLTWLVFILPSLSR
jgi:di/tricarboxylate transporter